MAMGNQQERQVLAGMWIYEKRLQYPMNITKPNAMVAKVIISQYGGPDGEIAASLRYLSQRFAAPNRMCMAVLNDVGSAGLECIPVDTKSLNCPITNTHF